MFLRARGKEWGLVIVDGSRDVLGARYKGTQERDGEIKELTVERVNLICGEDCKFLKGAEREQGNLNLRSSYCFAGRQGGRWVR